MPSICEIYLKLIQLGKMRFLGMDWLSRQGYCVICADGQAVAIEPEEVNMIEADKAKAPLNCYSSQES